MKRTIVSAAIVAGLSFAPAAFAGDVEDMAEMQRQLNKEVMGKPFSAGDVAKVDAEVADAMKRYIKPPERPPSMWGSGVLGAGILGSAILGSAILGWRPGYTCAPAYNFGWRGYGGCGYDYRYHRPYW